MKRSQPQPFSLSVLLFFLVAAITHADTTVTPSTPQPLNVTDPGQVITSGSVQVQAGSTGVLQGGNVVKLEPGFHAFASSYFYAFVDLNLGGFTSLADTDHDGLPDAWEMLYFGHLGVDPAADPDGDGVSNAAEYRAGTNPLVNESIASLPTGVLVVVRLPTGQYNGVKTVDWSIISVP